MRYHIARPIIDSFLLLLLFSVVIVSGACASDSKLVFPLPGPGRTTYSNSAFKYTITYPSDWHLVTESNETVAIVLYTRDRAVPNAVAFEIKGFSNPDGLDAQTWWQKHHPPDGLETAAGPITVANSVEGFVATGHGQRPYTLYTFARGGVACQILVIHSDEANTKIAQDTVKTFEWD